MKTKLTWNERFALIDHHKPTDEQIMAAFSCTPVELETVRMMRERGSLSASKDLDVTKYPTIFTDLPAVSEAPVSSAPAATATRRPTTRGVTRTTTTVRSAVGTDDASQAPPQSATKKSAQPKKRGRKGNKITDAFRNIPTTATSVEDFAKKYGVSVPVLRQSKRFDTSPELGSVVVKKNKDSGVLEIWRETSEQPT